MDLSPASQATPMFERVERQLREDSIHDVDQVESDILRGFEGRPMPFEYRTLDTAAVKPPWFVIEIL